MIKVGVLGAAGKMGREVCRAVAADQATELVSAVDISVPTGLEVEGVAVSRDRSALVESDVEVVVDFTHPDAVLENALYCLDSGLHVVVGTTGVDAAGVEAIRSAAEAGEANAVIAPNFAIGAVLMIHLSKIAAPYFDRVEVVELHHDGKADAPSGTALRTAEVLSSFAWPERGDSAESVESARGADVDGIRVHSVRLPGLVADQKVIFGTTGQTLTIGHVTTDRSSFMPGVLLAIRAVRERSGLTIGLEPILGIGGSDSAG